MTDFGGRPFEDDLPPFNTNLNLYKTLIASGASEAGQVSHPVRAKRAGAGAPVLSDFNV